MIFYTCFIFFRNISFADNPRKFPGIICKGNISEEDKTSIKNHVKGIALQKICSATRNSFDSIVISIYMGLTTIAIYNNYFYFINIYYNEFLSCQICQ